ncbi:MAG: diguanylate cyclase [Bacilli bacterium]|nr:diguanylate cyclase [Bacilli bacterium]
MIIIGQFAKDNNITVKTLHHYEKVGVLFPVYVDSETGYRYYDENSQEDLVIILFLKELGFSLSEIKSAINEFDLESTLDLLAFKLKNLRNDNETVESRIYKIENILSSLHTPSKNNIDWKGIVKMSKLKTETGNYGKGQLIESRNKDFEEAKDNGTAFCLAVIDLNNFDKVNKTYGYNVGDIVLDRTYSEIKSFIKDFNQGVTLEYKSGDEYHLTFTKSSLEVSMLISKLLDAIVQVDYSDIADELRISATAGIVSINKNHKTYSDLLQEASIELYKNKSKNR